MLLCSCCENKIYSSYSLIFTTGNTFSLLCFCCENKSGLAISYFHNRNTTAWNRLKYACNIGLLYINGKLLMSSFQICLQNLDPGSSRSVNLDKPDQDNLESGNLPLVNWPQLGRFLSNFRTFWFKWSPNESHTSCMILNGVTQPPVGKLAVKQPFLARF